MQTKRTVNETSTSVQNINDLMIFEHKDNKSAYLKNSEFRNLCFR